MCDTGYPKKFNYSINLLMPLQRCTSIYSYLCPSTLLHKNLSTFTLIDEKSRRLCLSPYKEQRKLGVPYDSHLRQEKQEFRARVTGD